jgi:hypothetical protein
VHIEILTFDLQLDGEDGGIRQPFLPLAISS